METRVSMASRISPGMTPTEFCYWLQGKFELDAVERESGAGPAPMTSAQVAVIKAHLELVFVHSIDAAENTTPEVKAKLDAAHAGNPLGHPPYPPRPDGVLFRC